MNTTSKSSGILGVQSAQLFLGKSILCGVNINAVAADTVVTIHDNSSAAGKVIFKYTFDISADLGLSEYIELPCVRADVGLFVVVVGAGSEVIVHYK